MMRWAGYVWTAFRKAFIHPIWELDKKLGPLTAVLPVAAFAIAGYVTKNLAWGLVGLVGGAFVLTFTVLVIEVAPGDEVEAVLEARPPTPVSDAHKDQLKKIADQFRSAVRREEGISETSDDWRAFAGHFPEIADELRRCNQLVVEVDHRQQELRNYIGGMVDQSPVSEDRKATAYDFVTTTIGRRAVVPNGLIPPIKFEWKDFQNVAQVSSDVTPSALWGIVPNGDPGMGAIKLSVEQMLIDAKSSDQAKAVAQAVQDLHAMENEVARNLDRIGRRAAITGSCPDCAL